MLHQFPLMLGGMFRCRFRTLINTRLMHVSSVGVTPFSDRLTTFVLGVIALGICAPCVYAADDYTRARAAMVEEIADDARFTAPMTGRRGFKSAVMDVMNRVPRHEFVEPKLAKSAYENRPLPIGHGQTISQPYIVALMTDILDVEANDVVLEVGTGSGYQAAVLAELVREVYTIEIIPPLHASATGRLKRLGYDNVFTRVGDGYYGWPDKAPFDAIIVTAAASQVPPPLIDQLKRGGKMVIPVGGLFFTQQLMVVEKKADGAITNRQILPVAFVPLTGEH